MNALTAAVYAEDAAVEERRKAALEAGRTAKRHNSEVDHLSTAHAAATADLARQVSASASLVADLQRERQRADAERSRADDALVDLQHSNKELLQVRKAWSEADTRVSLLLQELRSMRLRAEACEKETKSEAEAEDAYAVAADRTDAVRAAAMRS